MLTWVVCMSLHRVDYAHPLEDLRGAQLKAIIESDQRKDREYRRSILESGDAPCTCPEHTSWETQPEHFSGLVRAGRLQAPDDGFHHMCDVARPTLDSNIDFETWGREPWRTDCEPQFLVLCVFCAVSLAARGHELLGIRYFVAALVTLHGGLVGCYDRSRWPFLIDELLENFVRLVEEGSAFTWISPPRPFKVMQLHPRHFGSGHSDDKAGSLSLTELSFRIGHALGLVDSLINVWQPYLVQGSATFSKFVRIHEEGLSDWEWTYADICAHSRAALRDSRTFARSAPDRDRLQQTPSVPVRVGTSIPFGPPKDVARVLNAFAGMLVPSRDMHCDARDEGHGQTSEHFLRLEVTSVDSSARGYLAALARHGWVPRNGVAQQCDVEELWRCFPSSLFELVHVRNGLDHMAWPLKGLHELLRATKPGGRLVLWHWQNEHPERWKGLASGPHQWGFDLCPSPNRAAAVACDRAGGVPKGHAFPILWSYAQAYNLTREFSGSAELLSARYEPDPRIKNSLNRYVVFEYRRLAP